MAFSNACRSRDVYMLVFVMVQAASLSVEESLKIGPWGGEGGIEWSFKPSQGGSINEIAVTMLLMFQDEEEETSDLLAISFKTDNGDAKYGPYGSETGTPFSLPMEGGAIVEFHGRADNKGVHAIGVYVVPKGFLVTSNSKCRVKPKVDELYRQDRGLGEGLLGSSGMTEYLGGYMNYIWNQETSKFIRYK
ncbi:Agglutinin [Morella rubra]|uniref:Agglutinin n=1 Tax=Morella rubra TaxID=262757 RepID=A0A6A1W5S7_9ROSI|nr:Agglutinin [Morella rubra]